MASSSLSLLRALSEQLGLVTDITSCQDLKKKRRYKSGTSQSWN